MTARTHRLHRQAITTSVTLLSTSTLAARRAINVLGDWIPLRTVVPSEQDAAAEAARFHSVIPWNVITTECASDGSHNHRGVKIHWLAPSHSAGWLSPSPPQPRHSILAITQADNSSSSIDDGDINQNADDRAGILDPFRSTLSPTKLRVAHFFRRPVQASYLLGSSSTVPVLKVVLPKPATTQSDDDAFTHPTPPTNGLKEVVIPYDDDSTPLDAVLPMEVRSNLWSPATGLYQLPHSQLCIRPLPSGWHDRQLPPSTLVFHRPLESLTDERVRVASAHGDDRMAKLRKIGHSGGTTAGQFRLESDDLAGLDIRLCGSTKRSSMFAEAHESMLAGSIERLQSTRVLRNGRNGSSSTLASTGDDVDDDDGEEERRRRTSDCWMEFRATVRNPTGFFRRQGRGDASRRTAKVPDLPYE